MPIRPPPRDNDGRLVPHDHEDIADNHGVIRRISRRQIVKDANGQERLSSMAFNPSSDPTGGMSVDLEQSILDAGLKPKDFVTSPDWPGAVRFSAGSLRSEDMKVGYHPLPENPHHGEVWGQFSRKKKQRLREICMWLVCIPGVEPHNK